MPITAQGKTVLGVPAPENVPIHWWHRDDRYAERFKPWDQVRRHHRRNRSLEIDRRGWDGDGGGVVFRTDTANAPRIFAMNELPELDELVQVGLF